ncbi:hypothetical protein [Elioraea rosea]|uniref:hypothetical protein n=1 Tax=Elioraea rosea TaxID=2492390 RepID=UPI001182799D|nr:hypothetical protein [Elioraea rosea]
MPFPLCSFRLRNAFVGLAALALAGLPHAPALATDTIAGPVEATLLRVIDGDTLLVRARVPSGSTSRWSPACGCAT